MFASTEAMMRQTVSRHADPIPGLKEVVQGLRDRKIKIGSSTGYTSPIMKKLVQEAAKRGYVPDAVVCASETVGSMLTMGERFNQPWSPMMWAGKGLVALGKSDWLTAGELLIPAILLTGTVFYLSLITSERLYATGWSNLQNNRRRPKSRVAAACYRRGEAAECPLPG